MTSDETHEDFDYPPQDDFENCPEGGEHDWHYTGKAIHGEQWNGPVDLTELKCSRCDLTQWD